METGNEREAGAGGSGFARVIKGIALVGGGISVVVGLLVVVSVTLRSRWLNLGGVPGDFEIVQMLTAISVFCFLPLCQLRGGHVIVDAASQGWREVFRRRVDGIWEIVAALVFGLIAWQLGQGAVGMEQSHTRSMVLGWPISPAVWISAGLCGLLALVALVRGISHFSARSGGSGN